jgi:hypothetical protein
MAKNFEAVTLLLKKPEEVLPPWQLPWESISALSDVKLSNVVIKSKSVCPENVTRHCWSDVEEETDVDDCAQGAFFHRNCSAARDCLTPVECAPKNFNEHVVSSPKIVHPSSVVDMELKKVIMRQ